MYAQKSAADSPEKKLLGQTKEDTVRVYLLNDCAYKFFYSDNKKSFRYANEAEKLSNSLNYPKGQAESLIIIGLNHYFIRNYPQAIEYFQRSLLIKEQLNVRSGTDFNNKIFYISTIFINEADYNFPTRMKIRFMCDASGRGDDIYIDNIRITGKFSTSNMRSVINVPISELHSSNEESKEELKPIEAIESISIYPNPVQEELTIEAPYEIANAATISSAGVVIWGIQLSEGENKYDISDLPIGIYLICTETKEGLITHKFIKQ